VLYPKIKPIMDMIIPDESPIAKAAMAGLAETIMPSNRFRELLEHAPDAYVEQIFIVLDAELDHRIKRSRDQAVA